MLRHRRAVEIEWHLCFFRPALTLAPRCYIAGRPVGRFGREFGWWVTSGRGGAAAAPARVNTRRRDGVPLA